jgi:hypothetical protein
MGIAKAEPEDEGLPFGLRIHAHEHGWEFSVKAVLGHHIVLCFRHVGKGVMANKVTDLAPTGAKRIGANRNRIDAVDLVGH